MKIYRWFTLCAAIVITVLEAWLFTSASATDTQTDSPTKVEMVMGASGCTP
jgi:hypothetical protein